VVYFSPEMLHYGESRASGSAASLFLSWRLGLKDCIIRIWKTRGVFTFMMYFFKSFTELATAALLAQNYELLCGL